MTQTDRKTVELLAQDFEDSAELSVSMSNSAYRKVASIMRALLKERDQLRVNLAREKMDRLTEWLNEDPAHGVWLIEAMDEATISSLRTILGATK